MPTAGKNTLKVIACAFAVLLAATTAYSDVFSLWPFGRRDGTKIFSDGEDPSDVLSPRSLRDEKIVINGYDAILSVAVVDMQLADAVAVLRKSFPDASFAANRSSVLMEKNVGNDKVKRVYLLALPGVEGLIQFSMDVPDGIKKNGRASWEKSLPLMSGAEDVTGIYLPDRKAFYGTYGVRGVTREQMLSELGGKLRADGWKGVSGEDADMVGGTGEVFMKGDGSSGDAPVLVLGMTSAYDGQGMQAAFYLKNGAK